MTLIGYINNPQTLCVGRPEVVTGECRRALEGGVDISSAACAVGLATPDQSLRALVAAAPPGPGRLCR